MSVENMYLSKYKEVCRCCLDNPGSKNMWDEYVNGNEREVYGEMLSDCFSVRWEADNEELICESCIFRLREAVKLKIEFLAAQEVLKESLLSDGVESTKVDSKADLVQESIDASDTNISEGNDTGDVDYAINESAIFEITSDNKKPNKRSYKQYTNEDMSNAMEAVTMHGKTMLEAAKMFSIPRKTLAQRLLMPAEEQEAKEMAEEKKMKLVDEIKILLQNTNAVPFKAKIGKTYCAYCFTDGPSFDDASELRSHTELYHTTNYIRDVEFFMRPWYSNEIIRVDITEFQCTTCETSLEDWNAMFIHFLEVHEYEFDEAYNKVIPFSINRENMCVLCHETFTSFSGLDVHMNAHYCNYICYECGDPFLSSTRLDIHLRIHKTEKHPCDMCDKVFGSHHHKVKHIESVHNRNNDQSTDNVEVIIKREMEAEIEKMDAIMPCEYCGKCFGTSTTLDTHIKRTHTKKRRKSKKNYVCGVCGLEFEKFVNLKYHWREHMEMIPFRSMANVTVL